MSFSLSRKNVALLKDATLFGRPPFQYSPGKMPLIVHSSEQLPLEGLLIQYFLLNYLAFEACTSKPSQLVEGFLPSLSQT